jgi:hypothetical protein
MKYPFEASMEDLQRNIGKFVKAISDSLESEFLTMPKGEGFVDYPTFEKAYEALKRGTNSFASLSPSKLLGVVKRTPVSLCVLRAMLGFTAPEWAYVATQHTGVEIEQGYARSLDRRVRVRPLEPMPFTPAMETRVAALTAAACHLLRAGCPKTRPEDIHRLCKADTVEGPASLASAAKLGLPYPMLLYERFLGRPFASHKDAISELIGDVLECKIEKMLDKAGISFRKTKRAERLEGFDQAPDFIVPSEFNPVVVIEAKISEDDGTARDKITRVQHLAELSLRGAPSGQPRFEVVAVISGRGFGVRKEDMKKLLLATRGKVFTPHLLDKLVQNTRLKEFATKRQR